MSFHSIQAEDNPSWACRLDSASTPTAWVGGTNPVVHGSGLVTAGGALEPADTNAAIQFSGSSSDYLTVPSNAGIELYEPPFSIEFFMYLAQDATQVVFSKGVANTQWEFLCYQSRLYWEITTSTGGHYAIDTLVDVQPGNYHHIVCTYDGSHLRMWRNAMPCGEIAITGNTEHTASELTIGGQRAGANPLTSGSRVDEIALYKGVLLGPERVRAHYAALAESRPGAMASLIQQQAATAGPVLFYYPCNDRNSAGVVSDLGPNATHAHASQRGSWTSGGDVGPIWGEGHATGTAGTGEYQFGAGTLTPGDATSDSIKLIGAVGEGGSQGQGGATIDIPDVSHIATAATCKKCSIAFSVEPFDEQGNVYNTGFSSQQIFSIAEETLGTYGLGLVISWPSMTNPPEGYEPSNHWGHMEFFMLNGTAYTVATSTEGVVVPARKNTRICFTFDEGVVKLYVNGVAAPLHSPNGIPAELGLIGTRPLVKITEGSNFVKAVGSTHWNETPGGVGENGTHIGSGSVRGAHIPRGTTCYRVINNTELELSAPAEGSGSAEIEETIEICANQPPARIGAQGEYKPTADTCRVRTSQWVMLGGVLSEAQAKAQSELANGKLVLIPSAANLLVSTVGRLASAPAAIIEASSRLISASHKRLHGTCLFSPVANLRSPAGVVAAPIAMSAGALLTSTHPPPLPNAPLFATSAPTQSVFAVPA